MKALPAIFYRDPAESLDKLRSLRKVADKQAERRAERERRHKRMRIRALVNEVMRGGGEHGG